MNTLISTEQGQRAPLPLPVRQFQRFMVIFHIVFIAGLAFTLYNRLQRTEFRLDMLEMIIIGLVLTQLGLYLRFFAFPIGSSRALDWWGVYFPVSFSLWFITWRLEPAFEWAVLGYLGQMFGALSPKYSLPGGAAVFLLYFPTKIGWAGLAHLSLREWLGYGSIVIGWTALGLFLHKLARTSAERAALIQQLEAAQHELELARQRDTEIAGLRERERLARELHDSLGHGLVTLTVQLEAVQRLCASNPVRAAALIEEMKILTRTTMEQLRRSLAGLRTPGLGDRPLKSMLEDLCQEVSRRGTLKVECKIPAEIGSFSPALAEALWRTAQEGLANVEKHAQATIAKVHVELTKGAAGRQPSGRSVLLSVTDDGISLPAGAEGKPGHYGLRGLRERIEGLGGALRISAADPKGTLVEACLPLFDEERK